jgi:putative sterol carrier protein
VESALGPATAADVTLTITEEDARAMLSGELDPSVAFMRGTLKTSGDPGLLLRLLAGWSTEPARQARITMGKKADLP